MSIGNVVLSFEHSIYSDVYLAISSVMAANETNNQQRLRTRGHVVEIGKVLVLYRCVVPEVTFIDNLAKRMRRFGTETGSERAFTVEVCWYVANLMVKGLSCYGLVSPVLWR